MRRPALWSLLLVACAGSQAATRTYVGPDDGAWHTAAYWSPAGVPLGGDDVLLGSHAPAGGGSDLNLSFASVYASGNRLKSLTLNASALSGTMVFNQLSSLSAMSATTINLGTSAARNTYNLGAGSVTTDKLTIGVASSQNTFSLFGAGVLNAGVVAVGSAGSGLFNQTGGTVSASGIVVGGGAGNGVYTLGNGTLHATSLDIGANGTFNLKTGGVLDGIFSIKSGGVFNLQGGGFAVAPHLGMNTGTLRLNGNTLTAKGLEGLNVAAIGAVIEGHSGNGQLILSNAAGNLNSYVGTLRNGQAGTLSLVKGGDGIQVLGGLNTHTGTTTVQAGILRAASDTGFSAGSAHVVNGGLLDANGHDVSFAALSGSGGTVGVSTGSVTVGGTGASGTYAGLLTGTGALNKVGIGQLTLAGGGSFAGTITVQAGSLGVGAVDGIAKGSRLALAGNGSVLNIGFNQTFAALSGGSGSTLSFATGSILNVGTSGTDSTFQGSFSGIGLFVKAGAGVLALGAGASDTLNPNNNAGLAMRVDAGTLRLDKAVGTRAVAGQLQVAGGNVVLARSHQMADASLVTLTAGTLDLNGHSETIGFLGGTGGRVDVAGGALTVLQSAHGSFAGALTGGGSLTMAGPAADLTLSDVAGFTGRFVSNAGRLVLVGHSNATGHSAGNGATLRLGAGTHSVHNGTILASAGGTVEYHGAVVDNAFLRGAGKHVVVAGAGAAFNGVTSFNSTTIQQQGQASFTNFSNGGRLISDAAASIDGGSNTISGVIDVNATLSTADFSSSGVLRVSAGGTLVNGTGNLVFGGGSRTTVAAGGTLASAAGTSIELDGALLVNNGVVAGLTRVNHGSTAKGAGVFGAVEVGDGGSFSPGNSPGFTTVNGFVFGVGGSLRFEMADAAGAPGVGLDFIHNLGVLAVNAGATPASRFRLELVTLDLANTAAPALNFDAGAAHDFVLMHSLGGITGFDPSEIVIDASGFLNPTFGGAFSVATQGGDLLLRYTPMTTPVPEPGGFALLLAGLSVVGLRCRRVAKAAST